MENIQITYYDLLEVKPNSNSKEIIDAYKKKINKFKNINNFDNNQISEIKLFKKALYILINKNLRLKYNSNLKLNNEPLPMNHESSDTFDSVFKIDNSWMNNHNSINNNHEKKNKVNNENNIFSERIFSLSNLNKKPGYSTNDEINLRNPLQGRIDKSDIKS